MKNLFKPEMIKWLIYALIFILVFKLLWFIVEVSLLSSVGIDQEEDHSSKALYYRVKLTPNQASAPKKVLPVVTKIEGSIKEIKLLAIYNDSSISVVTVEYRGKSKVLSSGGIVNGFTLEGAGSNYAMFSKNAKNYKVLLDKKSKTAGSVSIIKTVASKPKSVSKKPLGGVTTEGSLKIVDRSLLNHYADNMEDIYKNIGIAEVKDGNKLKGFKINFVRRDTPFAKLGIRRNDIIKSINGREITSYSEAFSVYKNIKNLSEVNLVIQRGKEEMELDYEIN